MANYLKPKDAAKHIGVSQQQLRYYDELGLIEVMRTPKNHRLYNVENFGLNRAMVTIVGMFNELSNEQREIVMQHLNRIGNN